MKGDFQKYKKLAAFILPYWPLFAIALVFMLFSAVFDGVSLSMIVPLADRVLANKPITFPYHLPAFLQSIVDSINNIEPARMLKFISFGLVLVFFLKAVFDYIYKYIISDIGQRIIRDIRAKIYYKLQDLSIDFYSKYRSGELISRITNDVLLLEDSISYGIMDFFYQGFQLLVFMVIIFTINWMLSIWILVIVPIVAFPVFKIGKMLRKLAHKGQSKIADISSILFETISGTRVVKAFSMEEYEKKRFSENNRDYYHILVKQISKRLLLSPLLEFVTAVIAAVILFFGGKAVLRGQISFGVFTLFLASLLSMIRPMKRLSNIHAFYQQALAATERIYQVLEANPSIIEKASAVKVTGVANGIEFRDVYFSYEEGKPVLKGINFFAPANKITAIVGPSGSGKSTIVNLLLRFYDPDKGSVLLDGIDFKDLNLKSLRMNMAIVAQDTVLFNDTIANNIAYGSLSATKEEVVMAAKLANAHNFIESLPNGYDTNIGDLGNKLSGGQKQRIAIARAILRNPRILILDEATAHLDSQSEREVQSALEPLLKERTVVIIAHRLSTIKYADNIIVLKHGNIAEQGKHDELMAMDGIYYGLYKLQSL